ncbi:MAG: hypothetical protein V2I57_09695 [Xanthomonadales bacterium]|jgi:hypothetical protein|nr:hypothetical protein [Xanthomonadales bacterium]
MLVNACTAPVTESSLSDYFSRQLRHCASESGTAPPEDTLWYVAGLLDRFGRSEMLFAFEDGRLDLRPLALLYADAREASTERERCLLLRQLGDLALFLGSLFPQRFERRGIRRDYFVGMGTSAYDYLGDNALGNRSLFSELARLFSSLLDLIERCFRRRDRLDAHDVLRLYQRWRQTRDPSIARQLKDLGVELPGE